MSIRILKNGVLDTIQDAGRDGYGFLGINPGGAMDRVAMRVANILVGNEPGTAVIEMHIPAAELLFEETALVALSGADVSAQVDGEEIPMLHPVIIKKGTRLGFGKRRSGARTYLSVRGGFVADEWLGSCSTHTKAVAGGFKGRPLQKSDCIFLKEKFDHTFSPGENRKVLPWSVNVSDLYTKERICFVPGNEYFLLDETDKHKLAETPCVVSRESDRMGFRLTTGLRLMPKKNEMISAAVTRGTIQLLPGGQMIILMADHQTTGGYPVIGYVTSADFPTLAQRQPGESFFLQQVDLSFAEETVYRQEMNLQLLQNACTFRLKEWLISG